MVDLSGNLLWCTLEILQRQIKPISQWRSGSSMTMKLSNKQLHKRLIYISMYQAHVTNVSTFCIGYLELQQQHQRGMMMNGTITVTLQI
jgi:hypothetical protein